MEMYTFSALGIHLVREVKKRQSKTLNLKFVGYLIVYLRVSVKIQIRRLAYNRRLSPKYRRRTPVKNCENLET